MKPVEDYAIRKASNDKYNGWVDMLGNYGIPSSVAIMTDPSMIAGGIAGGKYANHIGRNAAESVMRLGDIAQNNPSLGFRTLVKNPNTWKFIFGNRPDLAYKTGLRYSGNSAGVDYVLDIDG